MKIKKSDPQLAYVVAINRNDSEAPRLGKIVDDKIYLDENEAREKCNKINTVYDSPMPMFAVYEIDILFLRKR